MSFSSQFYPVFVSIIFLVLIREHEGITGYLRSHYMGRVWYKNKVQAKISVVVNRCQKKYLLKESIVIVWSILKAVSTK